MDMPRADLWTIPHNVNMTVNPSNDNNLLQRLTDKFNDEHAKKVKEVRHAFGLAGGDAMNSLVMIDTIHRLGIDYHFKREIDSKLHLDSSNWYFIELQNKAREILPYLHGRSIYLVGMMGSGKTTVGKILSEVLEYSFCDSDLLVEGNVGGMSVAEIFKLYGEGYFRDKESEALRYLSLMHRLVVSTGGGAVTRPINWNYMHKGISVYIDVPLEALAQRIAAVGTASRPLLHQESGDAYTKAFMRLSTLLEERRNAYANASTTVFLESISAKLGHRDVSNLTPTIIAIEALEQIEGYLKDESSLPF